MEYDAWVDFNDVDENGQVLTLAKFASRRLDVGENILVGDHEGNRCRGSVVSVDTQFIKIALNLVFARVDTRPRD